MEECIRLATAITVTTSALREALSSQNPNIHILPNLISQELWNLPCPPSSGPVVIGFFGTATHLEDLQMIEAALFQVARRHGNNVAFTFMGCASEAVRQLPSFALIGFEPRYEEYARKLQSTPVDIALVPLLDTPFNRCKSNIKWLEYSSCRVAGIFSNLTPYNTCVQNEKTGLLVGNSPADWFEAIDYLIRNPEKRKAIAQQAQHQVMAEYTLATKGHKYFEACRQVLENHRNVGHQYSLGGSRLSERTASGSSHCQVLGISLDHAAKENPALLQSINRINRYVARGNSRLAARIAQKELGHLSEARFLIEKLNTQSALVP